MKSAAPTPLLEVSGLEVTYAIRGKAPLHAVADVSLTVGAGETVGLVGESGSGKTTIGRAILGLAPVSGGRITLAGADITRVPPPERRRLSRIVQVVFQDPYSSLNPTRTVAQTLAEMLRIEGHLTKEEVQDRVRISLERVGLDGTAAYRYPRHFSGGQRQRIAIARALMANPRLVICDEAVSALDLSIQAQILNLLATLQSELGLSYLFISHDLAVVRYVARRVVVLYRGQIMEQGSASEVYKAPAHPYTQALLAAAPLADPELQRARRGLRTANSTATATVQAEMSEFGCRFATRCPHVVDRCRDSRPPFESTSSGAQVACFEWQAIAGQRSGRGTNHREQA